MHGRRVLITLSAVAFLAALPLGLLSCGGGSSAASVDTSTTHVVGKSKEDIGKYITQIAGCNDCHTPGVMQGRELKDIPESQWLTGSPLGFNGPWGTSYAANLRLKVTPYNEAIFIATMRKRAERPPMPWSALHAMTDEDLGAVFAYLKALGPSGTPMPEPLPVGKVPPQPYIDMVPNMGPAPEPPAVQMK